MANGLDIFISYKRGEGDNAAREIENYLTHKKNYSVFRDVDRIDGEEDWKQKIIRSIKKSDIFILVLTPFALSSVEVQKEVREAQRWKKRILPCKLDTIHIEELKWNLGKLTIIEYSERNISALLLSIDNSIDTFLSEKRKQLVKKGISTALSIVAIGLVTYILLGYFLNPQIEISYESNLNIIIGTDYAQMFVNLSRPFGISVDTLDNVYVADTGNNRIQKFTSDGNFIKKWGRLGTDPGKFSRPNGIAVDTSGNVYVADTDNNRIQKFTSDGNFIKKWGGEGTDPGKFSFPNGISVDTSGNVYVADTYNNRIEKFTSDGNFIKKWGRLGTDPGKFSRPSGIAVDTSGNVYVADTGNNRIEKFTSDGNFIKKWGELGKDIFEFSFPSDIAVDTSGNVYVADTDNNRIQKFTSDGNFIKKWGGEGTDLDKFSGPSGISVDTSGNVYVADTYNNRIEKFASDAISIRNNIIDRP